MLAEKWPISADAGSRIRIPQRAGVTYRVLAQSDMQHVALAGACQEAPGPDWPRPPNTMRARSHNAPLLWVSLETPPNPGVRMAA